MVRYRREIDGLRALAVLPVIFFHAGFDGFKGGFVGVDVFFVISGFLITSIIIAERQSGCFSLAGFYERRARRILPALTLVLLVCIPLAWLWFIPSDTEEFSLSLIFASTFTSNIFFWQNVHYFDTAADLKPLLHTWSLAIEEQFYLFFPLFLLLFWRFGRNLMLGLIIILLAASLVLAQWGSMNVPTANFYLLPTRGWELMIGGLLAFLFFRYPGLARPGDRQLPLYQALSIAGLLLLALSFMYFDPDTPFPGAYALIPTAGAALIIIFATEQTLVGSLLGMRAMVLIGLISYSAYLWHFPLFAFSRYRVDGEPGALMLFALSCTALVLAFFSWKYFEQPFRRKNTVSTPRFFKLAGFATAVILILGVIGDQTSGFLRMKMNENQISMLKTASSSTMGGKCHTGGVGYTRPHDACEYYNPEVRWAVLGDSHAINLAHTLAEQLEPRGVGLKQLSFIGCVPSGTNTERGDHCARWSGEAVDYLVNDERIETVVISYRINAWLFGEHEKSYPELPDEVSPDERDIVWEDLKEIISRISDAGKNVIYVMQAPEISRRVEVLIYRFGADSRDLVGLEREWWDRRNAYAASRKDELEHNALVVDPTELFCNTRSCYAVRNGVAFYTDDDHLSIAGARLIAHLIVKGKGGG